MKHKYVLFFCGLFVCSIVYMLFCLYVVFVFGIIVTYVVVLLLYSVCRQESDQVSGTACYHLEVRVFGLEQRRTT